MHYELVPSIENPAAHTLDLVHRSGRTKLADVVLDDDVLDGIEYARHHLERIVRAANRELPRGLGGPNA